MRERARKLIAEARQGLVSPALSPTEPAAVSASSRRSLSHSHSPSPTSESTPGRGVSPSAPSSTSSSTTSLRSAGKLQSFKKLVDKAQEAGGLKSLSRSF